MAGAGRALVHDQHRARRHLQYGLSGRTQQQAPEAPLGLGCRRRSVGHRRRTDDGRCRVTGDDRRLDLDVGIVLAVAGELRAQ